MKKLSRSPAKNSKTSKMYKHIRFGPKALSIPLKTFLFLLLFIILQIGRLPQKGLNLFIRLVKKRPSLSAPHKFHLPRRKRGRPRTTLWIIWQMRRLTRLFRHLVPRPARLRLLLVIIGVIFILYSVLIIKLTTTLPSPRQLTTNTPPLTTEIYDRNGKLLYQIYEGQNRKLVKLDDLPSGLINATIAIEDKHFFSHPGVDIWGIIRAAKADLAGQKLEGGSTITQQLIKNTMLTPDQTWSRKIKEAILAFWAERIYSKDEILQMYFNEAPYGGPAWGVEAASEMYFGKKASELTLAESAYLAGLPASPTQYSPYGIHPEQGKQRQKQVLQQMVEDEYLTKAQADKAYAQKLDFRPPTIDIKAPHFVMYVRSLLAAEYGDRVVSQGGLKVYTTLDLNIQKMAEGVVQNQLDQLSSLNVGNGAAMVTDTQTGQIMAMVGSKNYWGPQGNYNAALALRQPGSSIKVVTYATAFKQGFSPGNVLLDTPTNFPNAWGQSYAPVNYDGQFHGPVTIRTAFGSSYNIPAVKMLATVGVPAMMQTAREMGINTWDPNGNYGLSLTLGGGAVRLIDMMSVYGTVADAGVKHQPQAILKVTDPYDNVLEDHTHDGGQQILTLEVAYLLSNVLSDDSARAPAFGPHSLLYIPGHTVAVKTGTSDDKRDNWTFGYTPEYVVGVWVGNNDYSPMDPALTSGITGAAPIWHDIITNLLAGQPDTAFSRPPGIIEATVDGHKDLAISGQVPKTILGYKNVPQTDQNGQQKIITAYTDPFSAYLPNESQVKAAQ